MTRMDEYTNTRMNESTSTPLESPDAHERVRSTRETVQAYYDRLATRGDWAAFMADDLAFTTYTSPIKQVRGKDAFLKAADGFYASVISVQVRDLLVEGEKACAFTHYDLRPPNGGPAFTSDVAEVFVVRGGNVVEFGIYFDSVAFQKR